MLFFEKNSIKFLKKTRPKTMLFFKKTALFYVSKKFHKKNDSVDEGEVADDGTKKEKKIL